MQLLFQVRFLVGKWLNIGGLGDDDDDDDDDDDEEEENVDFEEESGRFDDNTNDANRFLHGPMLLRIVCGSLC